MLNKIHIKISLVIHLFNFSRNTFNVTNKFYYIAKCVFKKNWVRSVMKNPNPYNKLIYLL